MFRAVVANYASAFLWQAPGPEASSDRLKAWKPR